MLQLSITLSLVREQRQWVLLSRVLCLHERHIRNKVDGKETVLWYVSDPTATISRPLKEIKFFEKKLIKAGETVAYKFEIDPIRDLSYPDATGKRILEEGVFKIQVGDKKLLIELIKYSD